MKKPRTPYEDVLWLQKKGVWYDETIPEWAQLEAERLGCCEGHAVVQEYAYKHEIERLRNLLKQARACLLNLQPDGPNPMSVQMQKMIHEISVGLGDVDGSDS